MSRFAQPAVLIANASMFALIAQALAADSPAVADPRSGEDHVSSVPKLTQWYTSALEHAIREAPEQYWWIHRRWKDNRPAKKKQKKAA